MHLNIKDDEAHRLATELARITGETLTTAVTKALQERLARERRRLGRTEIAERLMAIGREYAALPTRDAAGADCALGYDENGLPW